MLLSGAVWSQNRLHNDLFTDYETIACPYDTAQSVTQPVGWEIYQTLDGNWEGPVDSSRCINGFKSTGPTPGCVVPLDQIDLARPLFIRANLNQYPPTWAFEPNRLYNVAFCSWMQPHTTAWKQGADCEQGVCSGLFIGVAIPDTNGVPGGNTRLNTGVAQADPYGPPYCEGFNTCLPTEYFTDQSLTYFVAKFSFPDTLNPAGASLVLSSTEISPIYWTADLTQVTAYPYHWANGVFIVPIESTASSYAPSYLARYIASGYPSAANPSYIEAVPEPNSSQSQVIILTVDPYQTLDIQPFTYFRGGLTAGSDSVRHQFVLANNGGDICLNVVDLVYGGGTEYRHHSGQVGFNNPFSCMQFRDQSALRVAENGVMHYGSHGVGMLALCAGAKLVLEQGCHLEIDAVMNIAECNDAGPAVPYMDVELHPGARLSFTENARLTNQFSRGQAMKLRVWMLGGELDDSRLPAGQQGIIERAWPAPKSDFAQNMTLSGNDGSARNLSLRYWSGGEETLLLRWSDAYGREVRTQTQAVAKEFNEFGVSAPLDAGMYFLSVESAGRRAVLKIVSGN